METRESDEDSQSRSQPHTSRTLAAAPAAPTATTALRLVVAESSAIPRHQRVAILDGLSTVSIGRDPTSRLRLKERSVSKVHASVFWDTFNAVWAIVDLGSACGTLVNGERLSGQRQPSAPRALRHTDRIIIASTTLVVHIHRDRLPCINCALVAHSVNELPLRPSRTLPSPPVAAPTPPPSAPRRKKSLKRTEAFPALVTYPGGGSPAPSVNLKLPEKRRPSFKQHASSSDSAPTGGTTTASCSTDDQLSGSSRRAHAAKSDDVTSRRRLVVRRPSPVRRPISEPSTLRTLGAQPPGDLPARCGSTPDVNGVLVVAVASQ